MRHLATINIKTLPLPHLFIKTSGVDLTRNPRPMSFKYKYMYERD